MLVLAWCSVMSCSKQWNETRFKSYYSTYSPDMNFRFSCQLELHHYQSLPFQIRSTGLYATWVGSGTLSVQEIFTRLDQYKRQLLSGTFCVNMDLEGTFQTGSMSVDKSSASFLPAEGFPAHTGGLSDSKDAMRHFDSDLPLINPGAHQTNYYQFWISVLMCIWRSKACLCVVRYKLES